MLENRASDFFAQHYNDKDLKRLDAISSSAVTTGNMFPDCALTVNIPAYYQERRLDDTLLHYLTQDAIFYRNPRFEVVVLINGPQGVNLENSQSYQDALNVLNYVEGNPEYEDMIRMTVATAHYQKGAVRIGRIRKDLAGLTLRRACETEGLDIENLVLVTNDADLIDVPSSYVSEIVKKFRSNQRLAALTGLIDYPYADFSTDHLFLTTQRYTDILDTITRHRGGHFILHGGNSAFRVGPYMEAGGIRRNRVSELRPLLTALKGRGADAVAFDKRMSIVTNARRQLAAIASRVPVVDRYRNFTQKGDLAESFQVPEDEVVLPEAGHKVTSVGFTGLLQRELQAIFDHRMLTFARRAEAKLGNDHNDQDVDLNLGKNRLEVVYRGLLTTNPEEMIKQEREMKLAGLLMGIKIHFIGRRIFIADIDKLRRGVVKKYSNY